jgi:hypothetical protein
VNALSRAPDAAGNCRPDAHLPDARAGAGRRGQARAVLGLLGDPRDKLLAVQRCQIQDLVRPERGSVACIVHRVNPNDDDRSFSTALVAASTRSLSAPNAEARPHVPHSAPPT